MGKCVALIVMYMCLVVLSNAGERKGKTTMTLCVITRIDSTYVSISIVLYR